MIIVTGIGRSGTSIVGGICHKLGVSMGQKFMPTDHNNIYGTYEDKVFFTLNSLFDNGRISEEDYKTEIHSTITLQDKQYDMWGFKDPQIGDKLKYYKPYNPKLIVCTRDLDGMLDSMRRAYAWNERISREFIRHRRKLLREALKDTDYLEVKFKSKSKVEDICNYLKVKPTKEAKEHEQ